VKKSAEVFDKFDSNKNGKLEKVEVSECFKAIGMNFGSDEKNDTFEELFSILDLDNSGYLNKIEFYMMIEALRRHV
jgi:Ca2+-binding EF-hand superfamily protein